MRSPEASPPDPATTVTAPLGVLRPRRSRRVLAAPPAPAPALVPSPVPLAHPSAPAAAPAGPPDEPGRPARAPAPAYAVSLRLLALVLIGFVVAVMVLGPLRQSRDQAVAFADLREELANGTAPVGQLDVGGRLLAPGAPVALLQVPQLDLEQVVLEGTSSTVLRSGPGHLRTSVLPGQAGTSVLLGRQAAYGGPFGRLSDLEVGAGIVVRTAQGEHRYEVTGLRTEGSPLPRPLTTGQGRLVLVTATGTSYAPSGVLRVDAELVTPAQPAPPAVLAPSALGAAERPMAGDRAALVPLVLLGQALLVGVGAVLWARVRWGARQAWVVGVPLVGGLGVAVADQAVRLLPNLL